MAENKTVYSNFNFCGEIVIPKKNGPWVKRDTYNGTDKITLNFGIKVDTNIGYVTATDWKHDEIKTKNTDGDDMTVRWADRFDEDIIKEVASSKKYVVHIGERKEFITIWDMVEYLETVLDGYDKPITATGRFVLRPGTGKSSDKVFREFQLQNVYAVGENYEPRLNMNMELYYDRDSMDKSTLEENGKIVMKCYTPQWVTSEGVTKMFAIPVVFNTAVFDLTKEKHKKFYDYKMRYLTTKSRNPVHMNWAIGVVNGAEEIPFSIDTLTDAQREQVELGLTKLEDYRQRGTIYGQRVNELRLIKPILKGEFADSATAEPSIYTASEFEDEIYTPKSDETVDDMVNGGKSKSKPKQEPVANATNDDDDTLENMF